MWGITRWIRRRLKYTFSSVKRYRAGLKRSVQVKATVTLQIKHLKLNSKKVLCTCILKPTWIFNALKKPKWLFLRLVVTITYGLFLRHGESSGNAFAFTIISRLHGIVAVLLSNGSVACVMHTCVCWHSRVVRRSRIWLIWISEYCLNKVGEAKLRQSLHKMFPYDRGCSE